VNTRRVFWGVLIAGAVWLTLEAGVHVVTAVAETRHLPQPGYGQRNWFSLEGFYSLLQILIGFLVFAVVLTHPIGVWFRIAHRQMISKRLSATPTPHGKYLPWGRNLRRHASSPARYSGLRPRKTFRVARHEED